MVRLVQLLSSRITKKLPFPRTMLFTVIIVILSTSTRMSKGAIESTKKSGYDHVNRTSLGNSTCFHFLNSRCNVMRCQLDTMTDLGRLVSNASMVDTLILSFNRIRRITPNAFQRLVTLQTLNLSYNGLQRIQRNAFYGLKNLKMLDLSFNSLRTWNTLGITKHLPSLSELNVTGNPSWLPGQHIRDLPNITVIKGMACYAIPYLHGSVCCDLHRRHAKNILAKNALSITHQCTRIDFSFHGNFTSTWSPNFTTKCYVVENYIQVQTRVINHKSWFFSVDNIALCLQESNKFVIPNMVLAITAIFSNFVVITTVAVSPVLRKNVGLFLISNMAIGDFLRGLWLFILTLTRRVMTSSEFYEIQLPVFCFSLYAILLASQYTSVILGFLVTVERYLCIVHAMKPHLHVSLKKAVYLVIGAFILLSAAIFLPLIRKRPKDAYLCANQGSSLGTLFIDTRLPVAIILYLVGYILYARMFYTVKKSSSNVGIKREGEMALRFLLMVSTNFIFGLVPMIVGQLFFAREYIPIMELDRNGKWKIFVFYLFVINPCLNPVLFAFRNEKFQTRIKRFFICGKVNPVIVPHMHGNQRKETAWTQDNNPPATSTTKNKLNNNDVKGQENTLNNVESSD